MERKHLIKIGITFIITLVLVFFGINYLKGINIFTPSNRYFIKFKNIDGLVVSNSVSIKGYKVGQIRNIKYDFSQEYPFTVEVAINDDIKFPEGTIFSLKDESLLGGKFIDITLGNSTNYIKNNDTVPSTVSNGLLTQLSEVLPQLSQTITNLDSITENLNMLIKNPELQATINSLSSTMKDLNTTVNHIKHSTESLPSTMDRFNNITTNLDNKIDSVNINAIITDINNSLNQMQLFVEKLNNKDSSLGLLLNNRDIYDNLNNTIKSTNSLMNDLREHPKRYVHFSIFGKKSK